jgi:hypothetical protein
MENSYISPVIIWMWILALSQTRQYKHMSQAIFNRTIYKEKFQIQYSRAKLVGKRIQNFKILVIMLNWS